jgi:hypothetical protein
VSTPKPQKRARRRNPLLGKTVHWYPRADTSQEARAALVTGPAMEHPESLLSLTIFEEHAVTLRTERNVHHINDPKLKLRPRMREQGAWAEILTHTLGLPKKDKDKGAS